MKYCAYVAVSKRNDSGVIKELSDHTKQFARNRLTENQDGTVETVTIDWVKL